MIQMLTYSGSEEWLKGDGVILNSLHDAQSLDEFEINIIDLSAPQFWRCSYNSCQEIESIADFVSMNTMILNSQHSNICILLPQNTVFYSDRRRDVYQKKTELKNMIDSMRRILCSIYEPLDSLEIVFENTNTQILDKKVNASFYFNNVSENILTRSIASEKVTTINMNVILTTLKILNYDALIAFLQEIKLIEKKDDEPEWIKVIEMFNDREQLEIIQQNKIKIDEANQNISNAKTILNKNNEYKSILYTNGDKLVKVVFEILESMLGCDLSDFQDVKKEDFLFELGGHYFIGEIKGVNHNVKSQNVSQLDVHYQSLKDDHPEIRDSDISAILIINHQKNKPVSEREPVHENQILLAKRNGSLIVETITLLKMFEKYKEAGLPREECIKLMKENTGLLSL